MIKSHPRANQYSFQSPVSDQVIDEFEKIGLDVRGNYQAHLVCHEPMTNTHDIWTLYTDISLNPVNILGPSNKLNINHPEYWEMKEISDEEQKQQEAGQQAIHAWLERSITDVCLEIKRLDPKFLMLQTEKFKSTGQKFYKTRQKWEKAIKSTLGFKNPTPIAKKWKYYFEPSAIKEASALIRQGSLIMPHPLIQHNGAGSLIQELEGVERAMAMPPLSYGLSAEYLPESTLDLENASNKVGSIDGYANVKSEIDQIFRPNFQELAALIESTNKALQAVNKIDYRTNGYTRARFEARKKRAAEMQEKLQQRRAKIEQHKKVMSFGKGILNQMKQDVEKKFGKNRDDEHLRRAVRELLRNSRINDAKAEELAEHTEIIWEGYDIKNYTGDDKKLLAFQKKAKESLVKFHKLTHGMTRVRRIEMTEKTDRAHANVYDGIVHMNPDNDISSFHHELFHLFESTNIEIYEQAQLYLISKMESTELVSMNELQGYGHKGPYKADEKGYRAHVSNSYMAKDYGDAWLGAEQLKASEVLSMCGQCISLESTNQIIEFGDKIEEGYEDEIAFILGILREAKVGKFGDVHDPVEMEALAKPLPKAKYKKNRAEDPNKLSKEEQQRRTRRDDGDDIISKTQRKKRRRASENQY